MVKRTEIYKTIHTYTYSVLCLIKKERQESMKLDEITVKTHKVFTCFVPLKNHRQNNKKQRFKDLREMGEIENTQKTKPEKALSLCLYLKPGKMRSQR